MRTNLAIGVIVIACTYGCPTPSNAAPSNTEFHPLAAVDTAVDEFHQLANKESYPEIYAQSSEVLKGSTSLNDWNSLIKSIRVTTGTEKSTQRMKWNIRKDDSKTFIDALYDSTFTGGDVKEEFIYEISGNSVLLAGYHVFGQTN